MLICLFCFMFVCFFIFPVFLFCLFCLFVCLFFPFLLFICLFYLFYCLFFPTFFYVLFFLFIYCVCLFVFFLSFVYLFILFICLFICFSFMFIWLFCLFVCFICLFYFFIGLCFAFLFFSFFSLFLNGSKLKIEKLEKMHNTSTIIKSLEIYAKYYILSCDSVDIQSTVKRNDLFVKLLQTEPYLPKHDLFATQYLHRWIHYWSVSIIDFEQRFSHKYKGVFRTQLKIYDRTFFAKIV